MNIKNISIYHPKSNASDNLHNTIKWMLEHKKALLKDIGDIKLVWNEAGIVIDLFDKQGNIITNCLC